MSAKKSKQDHAIENATKLEGTLAHAEHINPEELVEIPDLNTFIGLVDAWHTANIEMLKKMLTIPKDGSISVTYDHQQVPVEGDLYKGMMIGIQTAIGMFGQLPFAAMDDEPSQTH